MINHLIKLLIGKNRERGSGRLYPVLTAALMFFLLLSSPSFAEMLVIKSMDISPYRDAAKGFSSAVNVRVNEYDIRRDGSSRKEMLAVLDKFSPRLLFMLGSDALRLITGESDSPPGVFAFVLNPKSAFAGSNNKRPNMVGISMSVSPHRQFEQLLKLVPKTRKIGVVYDPSKVRELVEEGHEAAHKLGMTLVTRQVKNRGEAVDAVTSLEGKIDALWMIPDTTVITHESIEQMLLFSFRNSIPLIGISDKYVKKGALFALSSDPEEVGKQAGAIAMEMLSGKKFNRLPLIVRPDKPKMSININTADKIGIVVPDSIKESASKVYH